MKLNTKSLSEVSLGTPILAAGIYFARINSAKVEPNKNGDGNNLNLSLKLHGETVTLHGGGQARNSGFSVFRTISLKATDKYDPDKNLKELAVAIGLPEDADVEVDEQTLELKQGIGTDIKINITYKAAEGQYAEKNEVGSMRPIKATDNFNPSM